MTNAVGLRQSEIDANLLARALAKPMTGGCAHCPELRFEGTAAEVLEAQAEHRATHKFKRVSRRRMIRRLGSFKSPILTDEDEAEIQEEIRRRRRVHGLDEAA